MLITLNRSDVQININIIQYAINAFIRHCWLSDRKTTDLSTALHFYRPTPSGRPTRLRYPTVAMTKILHTEYCSPALSHPVFRRLSLTVAKIIFKQS